MSDQHTPNVQQHANSVQCYRCGAKHILETEGDALASALKSGWVLKGIKVICKWCAMPKQPLNVPYVVNDERVLEEDRGCFMDTKNDDGSIIVWKLLVFDPTEIRFSRPEWAFHRRVE